MNNNIIKPLVVFALENEGQNKLESLGFEVLYCGVGKINATYNLTRRLLDQSKSISYVLNLGSAGSHTFNSGMLVASNQFMQRDMNVTGLGFKLGETPFDEMAPTLTFARKFEFLPHGICGTGDSFLQEICPLSSDIIDMEAYALAKVCLKESVQFACVKYITDGADKEASHDWQINLINAAETFANFAEFI